VLSSLALLFILPASVFPYSGFLPLADFAAFWALFGFYAAVSLLFDLRGGYLLPCRYQKHCLMFPTYLAKWLRAAAVQGAVMTVSALLLLQAGRAAGIPGALAVLALLQAALIAVQPWLARLAGGLHVLERLTPPAGVRSKVSVWGGLDPAFTGGIAGWPGAAGIIVPEEWVRALPPAALEAAILHREGAVRTGSRVRGLIVAVLWNLAGFALSANLPGAGVSTVWELVQTFLGCTLWSFAGLLILPSLSRAGVLEADLWALRNGASREALETAIREQDHLQEDEPSRSPWIERIFHPIPSVERRLQNLDSGSPRWGAWNAARMALYLSWANFGLLSRAVHCNCGRPESWVLLPSD
jgi:Zn-dependent protease with chaperone function